LIDNKELTREKDKKSINSAYLLAQLVGNENVDPSMLNFHARISKTAMDKIFENMLSEIEP
jgi:hypothetical protein